MNILKTTIGSFLSRSKIPVDIKENENYDRVTIRINHNGISIRDREIGKNIGTKKQFILKAGQFVLSKIDARYGAFGIAPIECDGAIITGNFWAYDVDFEKVNIEWFNQFTNSPQFYELCERASAGITHRKYLSETFFLNYEIELPSVDDQLALIEAIKKVKIKHVTLTSELSHQLNLVKKLRQQLLQDAIRGKLVAQDPNDEPASVLLQKIKTEKEQLVKNKKLKKEKELPTIKPEEIPFEIPENWIWSKLGEVSQIKGGKRVPNGYKLLQNPTSHIYIRVTDMKKGSIDSSDLRYIDDKVYDKIKQYIITKNDLYMTIVGGTIGKCGLVPEMFHNMNLTENAARIIPFLDKKFLLIELSSPFCQDQFIEKTKQVGVQKMALNRFSNSLIPVPPYTEQQRIVQKLEQLMLLCDALEASVKQAQKRSQQLLQQVLREALTKPAKQEVTILKSISIEAERDEKYTSLVLAAEIIWQLNKTKTLGHIKLQKLIYLCDRTNKMNLAVNFLRHAMGPYDPELQRYIDAKLIEKEWFVYKENEQLKYQPLKKAGGHKIEFDKYFNDDKLKINTLIQLFENSRSARIEIVATLFSCWERMLENMQVVNDTSLLKNFYNWSEFKSKYTNEQVLNALRWMENQGLTPTL